MPGLIHKKPERKVYVILRNETLYECYKSSTVALKRVKELSKLYPVNDYVILSRRLLK